MRDAVKRPLKIGDKIEMEISQFLDEVDSRGEKLVGRKNYYGTAVLYIVGKGFVPFETKGAFKDLTTEREDSYPLPEHTWMGGRTTLPYQYSNEPRIRNRVCLAWVDSAGKQARPRSRIRLPAHSTPTWA